MRNSQPQVDDRWCVEVSITQVGPRAGRREWIGLAVIALPCLLYSMDLTVLNLAVPAISAALRPSSSELLWIVDIYGFMLAGSLITMGTLGDRIGRRRLLLIGAAAFGVASVVTAFSTSAAMLIAARALLGVAASTLAPSTLSLIRNMFVDPAQRTVAIGLWVASFSAGAAIGPPLGGLLLVHFWWGSVFLLAVPTMALLLVLGPVLLPEFRDPAAGRLDLPSATLSVVAVLAAIYGLKQIAANGPGWVPALWILAGLAVALVFLRRQRALADPLIDLALFRVRAFTASLATNVFGFIVLFGMLLFIAQYLQSVLGLSSLQAGLWMIPSGCAFIAGSLLTPTVVRWVRPAYVIAHGLVLAAVGFVMLTRVDVRSGLAMLVTGSIVSDFGLAAVVTLTTDLIVGAAPPGRAGAASAMSETSTELGGALGIAILGSIGMAVYRAGVSNALPQTVPSAVADAARNTLGEALAAAGGLPHQLRPELAQTARNAFTHGLHVAAGAGASLMLGLALLAWVLLRNGRVPEKQSILNTE
jgi:DHA2 family multidrug resistance protein-like MFS transporter